MPQGYLPLEQGAISWTAVLETKGSEADTPAAPAGPQALLGLRRSTGSRFVVFTIQNKNTQQMYWDLPFTKYYLTSYSGG